MQIIVLAIRVITNVPSFINADVSSSANAALQGKI